MSKLSRYLKKNPELKAILLIALEFAGVTVNQRARFLEQVDTDGDGIPDADDDTPNGEVAAAPKTRAKKVAK